MLRSSILLPMVFCATVAVAAQAPAPDRPAGGKPATPADQQPPTQQPPAPAGEKSAAAAKVTYTGCVKPGTAPESWVLENAEVAGKPGQTTAATSGASKATLNLTTKMGTDLKPHANHKIEVVGTVAPAKPSTAAPAAPGAAPGAAAGQAPRQELTVESVKMVSTTCP